MKGIFWRYDGRPVQAKRLQLGMTRKALARAIKMHPMTITRVEEGMGTAQTTKRVAEFLGLSLEDLVIPVA